jgi:protein-S-isoprenylcysteine O-methyltransferase Ste14
MKSAQLLDRFLQSNPFYRGMFELLLLIVLNLGIALAFGVRLTLLVALLSVGHWIATALREEAALQQRFPHTYRRYQRTTRWRMIPGLF